jgi:hypothetical protein
MFKLQQSKICSIFIGFFATISSKCVLRIIFICSFLFIVTNSKQLVRTGLEKLIHHIFIENEYNQLVRPVDIKTGLTVVSTELKFLQIDVVIFNLVLKSSFKNNH